MEVGSAAGTVLAVGAVGEAVGIGAFLQLGAGGLVAVAEGVDAVADGGRIVVAIGVGRGDGAKAGEVDLGGGTEALLCRFAGGLGLAPGDGEPGDDADSAGCVGGVGTHVAGGCVGSGCLVPVETELVVDGDHVSGAGAKHLGAADADACGAVVGTVAGIAVIAGRAIRRLLVEALPGEGLALGNPAGVLRRGAGDDGGGKDLAGVGEAALVAPEGTVAEVTVLEGEAVIVALALADVGSAGTRAGLAGIIGGAVVVVVAGLSVGHGEQAALAGGGGADVLLAGVLRGRADDGAARLDDADVGPLVRVADELSVAEVLVVGAIGVFDATADDLAGHADAVNAEVGVGAGVGVVARLVVGGELAADLGYAGIVGAGVLVVADGLVGAGFAEAFDAEVAEGAGVTVGAGGGVGGELAADRGDAGIVGAGVDVVADEGLLARQAGAPQAPVADGAGVGVVTGGSLVGVGEGAGALLQADRGAALHAGFEEVGALSVPGAFGEDVGGDVGDGRGIRVEAAAAIAAHVAEVDIGLRKHVFHVARAFGGEAAAEAERGGYPGAGDVVAAVEGHGVDAVVGPSPDGRAVSFGDVFPEVAVDVPDAPAIDALVHGAGGHELHVVGAKGIDTVADGRVIGVAVAVDRHLGSAAGQLPLEGRAEAFAGSLARGGCKPVVVVEPPGQDAGSGGGDGLVGTRVIGGGVGPGGLVAVDAEEVVDLDHLVGAGDFPGCEGDTEMADALEAGPAVIGQGALPEATPLGVADLGRGTVLVGETAFVHETSAQQQRDGKQDPAASHSSTPSSLQER